MLKILNLTCILFVSWVDELGQIDDIIRLADLKLLSRCQPILPVAVSMFP